MPKESPMSAPNVMVSNLMFKVALEYYVNGRAAYFLGCVFTTGNLFHHAVEMMLKGELSKTISFQDLADKKKFGHSLPKCWTAFKNLFSRVDLTEFDPMIPELDKFEQIRYPDNLLKYGGSASIGFDLGRGFVIPTLPGAPPFSKYQLGVGDVDAFFARAMPLCDLLAPTWLGSLPQQSQEMLLRDNGHAKDWSPG
jgi:hypothetical protein